MTTLDIRWEAFEYMNEDKTKRFETLCRRLFVAHFLNNQEIPHTNSSTPGIEVLPILEPKSIDGDLRKRISFQAKYTKTTDSAYSKLEHSAREAVDHFKGKLDLVYLFSNQTLTTTSKSYIGIQKIFNDAIIDVKVISNEDLLDLVSRYQDIAREFFPEKAARYAYPSRNSITCKTEINREDLEKAVRHESNTPVVNIFTDKMTWGTLFHSELYRPQTFIVKNCGLKTEIHGIENLYADFRQSNILLTGEAGFGKTAAFEYVFLQHALDEHMPIYYLPAYVFQADRVITHLQETIRDLIISGETVDGLLLIDGLEEAYVGNRGGASSLITKLGDSGSHFWVACRPGFYENLDIEDIGFFDYSVSVKSWDEGDFKGFVSKYEDYLKEPGIAARTETLIGNAVMETTSIYRPLYALLFLFLAVEDLQSNGDSRLVIRNEYDLIERFIELWFLRESRRDKRVYDINDYLTVLRMVALGVYESNNPTLTVCENVVRDLVVIASNKSKPIVERFCHREFCIYFIAESLIDGMQKGNLDLIQGFIHLYYDDVTNLCKVKLKTCSSSETRKMHDNMFMAYKQTYEPENDYLLPETRSVINEFDDLQMLSLRDEIIYFITRLPGAEKSCREFLDYAVQNIGGDIMLSLGLAYSATQIIHHPHTLAFARKLYPGTPEELRNRSWALVFYGDVSGENGYTYVDDGKGKWTNVRNGRWKRLIINIPHYYRSRILDIPFLYCFYASRNYRDCNSWKDLEVIERCDIENYDYTEEERIFLFEQKKKLVDAYREHLSSMESS